MIQPYLLVDSNTLPWIIVGIVLGVAILAVILVLLFKFVFIRKRYEKQIKELDRRYSYLDALMIGQDAQYIKRLEMISRTNLLYVDKYNEYQKKFKKVFEIDDKYAQGVIRQLKTLIDNKQYRQLKQAIQEGKKAIAAFESSANQLDSELTKLIKPEEEARQLALRLKENLRSVKQTYANNLSDLELVSNSLERIFEKLDNTFNEFDMHIDSAEYDDANDLLPVVDKVIEQLKNVLVDLPKLCVLVGKILPEKVSSLENESDSLTMQGYPLHHLLLTKKFEEYNNELNNLKNRLISLNIKDVKEDVDKFQNDIEIMHDNFRKEVDAKIYFDQNQNDIYNKVLILEKNFLRLVSLLPEMNRVYKISEEETKRINVLKDDINQLGSSKRVLDTFVHSSTPQPYSILQVKLEKLIDDYNSVSKEVSDFKVFLESLKLTSEEAYNLVFSYYYRLKQCELQLQNIAINATIEKYQPKIEQCYQLLNEIEEIIKVTPIDMELITSKVDELKTITNDLFDNVNNTSNVSQMAESAILYANRDRKHQIDVHQQLLLSEQLFFNGEFEKTYHDVVSLLKTKHVEDGNNNN